MYTFLINEDNTLTASVVERVMQRSKLVDNLHFLADTTYKGIDMSNYTVMLEYVLPVSKNYKTEILQKSAELYKNKLEQVLPFDTELTSEVGDIEIQLTFANTEMDSEGRITQYVRKVGPGVIHIMSINNWSDMIPDSALSSLDQRLLMMISQTKALNDQMNAVINNKADGLSYKNSILQLLSQGNPIGNAVKLSSDSSGDSSGGQDGTIRVVEF